MWKSFYVVVMSGCFVCIALPISAQEQLQKDSISYHKQLDNSILGLPNIEEYKPWMDFDLSLPTTPQVQTKKGNKMHLTLRPYTSNTPYNWDPIYQCKLVKKSDGSWQPEGALPTISAHAFSVKNNESMPMPKQGVSTDLMWIFTKDFWQFQRRKNRKKLDKVLQMIGNSD